MLRSTLRRIALAVLATTALGLGAACSQPRSTAPIEVASIAADAGALANGLYAVTQETPTVILDTSSFVPLILAAPPDLADDPHGRPLLEVTLAERYVKLLENFTRAHLGGKVAIVLGGEIVTIHKVRAVIDGGKMKITRCTDRACETIRSKLEIGGP